MALWKARGGSLNQEFDFRSWHCARGSLNKELDFGLWHSRRQGGSLNKKLDLDYGIVDGKGREV